MSSVQTPQFEPLDKIFIEKILFWQPIKRRKTKLILSVGAPSSPSYPISVCNEFDNQFIQPAEGGDNIHTLCRRSHVLV